MKVFLNKAETINNLFPCFSGAGWFDAGKKNPVPPRMANVLSITFIPAFARSLEASFLEVGIIVRVYISY